MAGLSRHEDTPGAAGRRAPLPEAAAIRRRADDARLEQRRLAIDAPPGVGGVAVFRPQAEPGQDFRLIAEEVDRDVLPAAGTVPVERTPASPTRLRKSAQRQARSLSSLAVPRCITCCLGKQAVPVLGALRPEQTVERRRAVDVGDADDDEVEAGRLHRGAAELS